MELEPDNGEEQELSLVEEIHLAAAETESWPEWMCHPRLWHPSLPESYAGDADA